MTSNKKYHTYLKSRLETTFIQQNNKLHRNNLYFLSGQILISQANVSS